MNKNLSQWRIGLRCGIKAVPHGCKESTLPEIHRGHPGNCPDEQRLNYYYFRYIKMSVVRFEDDVKKDYEMDQEQVYFIYF